MPTDFGDLQAATADRLGVNLCGRARREAGHRVGRARELGPARRRQGAGVENPLLAVYNHRCLCQVICDVIRS